MLLSLFYGTAVNVSGHCGHCFAALRSLFHSTAVTILWHCGHCFVALRSLFRGTAVTCSWHCSHCLVALRSLFRGTAVTVSWHCGHCFVALRLLFHRHDGASSPRWCKWLALWPVEHAVMLDCMGSDLDPSIKVSMPQCQSPSVIHTLPWSVS